MKRDEFMDLVGADYVDEYEEAQLSQEDATIVAKSKRTFVELLVHYPHPDVCTYPEYKGKPYYSIKYIEDGECFVGFGTYKPEVLSQYLRDYFMPSAQPEERTEERTETHASDLISRQAAIDAVNNAFDRETLLTGFVRSIAVRAIRDMPSAQPEITEEAVKEYCRKRCLCVVDGALLKKYASAQPEQRWILCSELQPDVNGWYITTISGEICGQDRAFSGMSEFANGKWMSGDDVDETEMTIAWMPLPEPYKEGETT